jgi:hypothetical protein
VAIDKQLSTHFWALWVILGEVQQQAFIGLVNSVITCTGINLIEVSMDQR